jgi:hypothetical protein
MCKQCAQVCRACVSKFAATLAKFSLCRCSLSLALFRNLGPPFHLQDPIFLNLTTILFLYCCISNEPYVKKPVVMTPMLVVSLAAPCSGMSACYCCPCRKWSWAINIHQGE